MKQDIEHLYTLDNKNLSNKIGNAFQEFKEALNSGKIRAAEPDGNSWRVNHWVKKGILLGFRAGEILDCSLSDQFHFFDKDTYPLKALTLSHRIRLVPGGSSIRDGSYVAPDVVIMPPAYINVGAYVDSHTMIDSHALVGSCAQIGCHVHISAGSQIGGVLEPIGALPVIIEDYVMIGGNCGIYEGTVVKKNCVIGAGVILTGSVPVYDLVREKVYRKSADIPLTIPEGAVVIPGSRPAKGEFAKKNGLSVSTPIIVKYRDEKTDAATALESALR